MKRETLRLTFLIGACICLASCAATTQVSVKTDYNHKASFSGYKTYALDLSEAPELRPTGQAALADALKSSLAARGITETGKGSADLIVVPVVSTQAKLHTMPTRNTTYVLSHRGYGSGDWYMNYDTTAYTEGTLVLDFLDRKKHQIVFRGLGQGVVTTAERNAAAIRDAVQRIVADIPK